MCTVPVAEVKCLRTFRSPQEHFFQKKHLLFNEVTTALSPHTAVYSGRAVGQRFDSRRDWCALSSPLKKSRAQLAEVV